jgi:hypothetical protein
MEARLTEKLKTSLASVRVVFWPGYIMTCVGARIYKVDENYSH